jgi:hypothetical protein
MRSPSTPLQHLIQFVGQWPDEEKALVRPAIQEHEATATSSSTGASVGFEPWVALVHTLDSGQRYYTAHRLEHERVVTASSALELAEKIATHTGGVAQAA